MSGTDSTGDSLLHDKITSNNNALASAADGPLDSGDKRDTEVGVSYDALAVHDESGWTLHIKTVGAQEADFSVDLHPEDNLLQLYDAVSRVTGLPREQQRLIYRGRILPRGGATGPDNSRTVAPSTISKDSPSHEQDGDTKVRDIVGLTDGHTIHLVRKQEVSEERNSTNETSDSSTTAASSSTNGTTTGSATATLLAALLGAGSAEERRNRRAHYRLREEDWIRPSPGSLEPVQQGLLTLHTLSSDNSSRQFFRGQWIDCRDTVNQWLEATVVAVVDPRDILRSHDGPMFDQSTPSAPTTDPVVALTDYDGRRRLLLEPCGESESDEQIDGVYYRRRGNNSGVQLLHIHYNGWPVRWDEWIRSDSERIRPFRVRTRHTGPHASPSVQTTMPNAPSVSFTGSNDEDATHANRLALLPELNRVLMTAQDLLDLAITNNAVSSDVAQTTNRPLPWLSPSEGSDNEHAQPIPSRLSRQRELEALAPFLDRLGRTLTDAAPHIAALASTLAEPECENDNDDEDDEEYETNTEHPSTLGGLLSLLSRDRRRNGQSVASSTAANPNSDVSASLASSTTGGNEHAPAADDDDYDDDDEEEETAVDDETAPVVIDPDHRDFTTGFVNTTRGVGGSTTRGSVGVSGNTGTRSPSNDDITGLLGAYLAAASLGGLASIGFGSGDGDGAEGLGRLLRDRGNGGGIDIHIHAVVTAPGLEGGIGLAALTGAAAAPIPVATPVAATTTGALGNLFGARDATSRRASRRSRQLSSNSNSNNESSSNDDDDGIFAELYSETPEPINHNNPTHSSMSSGDTLSRSSQPAAVLDWSSNSDDPVVFSLQRRTRSRSRSGRHPSPPVGRSSGSNSSIVSGGTNATTSNSVSSVASGQRNSGGMLRRFFRRHTDSSE